MKNNKLEQIKLFVSKLMNEENDSHSLCLSVLRGRLGSGRLYRDNEEILNTIHKEKIRLLEKVYKEIQGVGK